jgi:hypothetical protein
MLAIVIVTLDGLDGLLRRGFVKVAGVQFSIPL